MSRELKHPLKDSMASFPYLPRLGQPRPGAYPQIGFVSLVENGTQVLFATRRGDLRSRNKQI
jgi:hypothetical protein